MATSARNANEAPVITVDSDYGYLLSRYGWNEHSQKNGVWDDYYASNPNAVQDARLIPLYGVGSGWLSRNGALSGAGNWGVYWSSATWSLAGVALDYCFGNTLIYPAAADERLQVLSLRCHYC